MAVIDNNGEYQGIYNINNPDYYIPDDFYDELE